METSRLTHFWESSMGFIWRLLDIGDDAVETSRGCGRQRGKRRGIGTEEDDKEGGIGAGDAPVAPRRGVLV